MGSVTDPEISRIFSNNLKEHMIMKDITYRQLAELSGVCSTSISNYINQHRLPSAIVLYQLSKELDVTMDSLFRGR